MSTLHLGQTSQGPEADLCPVCQGRRWVRLEVPLGDPRFGTVIPCACQEKPLEEQRLTRLQRFSNLGVLTRVTFQSLSPSGRDADPQAQNSYREAYQAASEYAQEPHEWLLFTGPVGSGKTHLLAAIINRCLELGSPAMYISVPDLLDHLRSTYAPNTDTSYDQLFDHVRNVPLLALDDLGAQSSTPWAQEKLYQLLNHRFNRQLPTVVALNVPLSHLEEQLRARLEDKRMVLAKALGEHTAYLQQGGSRLEAEVLRAKTFEGFDARGNGGDSEDSKKLGLALEAAQDYARNPSGWLVFVGKPGCGKTHLAAAILNYRMKQGYQVSFKFVPDLLDHLRATFSPQSPITYDQLFEEVRSAPLLALDDLGAQSTTWAEEKLYQIIVYRQETRLPTIVTMRGDIENLPNKAMQSRLLDSSIVHVIPISSPSYRDRAARPATAQPGAPSHRDAPDGRQRRKG
ncbi:MAG: ATP-binding protein [Chloroflexi bacterium]|nr:ATP-binding protein [Chloroflexota bacterium]